VVATDGIQFIMKIYVPVRAMTLEAGTNYSTITASNMSKQKIVPYSVFYPRDAMLARVIGTATCPSVCMSVRHAPVLCQNEES